jgi:hypothetical protein
MFRRGPIVLLLVSLLSGCVSPSRDHRATPRRQPGIAVTSQTMKQCVSDLTRLNSRYTILPDQNFGGGCSAINSVQLMGVGIPVTNVTAIQCPVARALALWARSSLQSAASEWLGSRVVRIESMGSYSCRQVKGVASTKLSEHASANAIDVSGFQLADGRHITVEGGWNGDKSEQAFLRAIRSAACQQFQTVLSPDYNAAHYNHLHFDLGRGPYCR